MQTQQYISDVNYKRSRQKQYSYVIWLCDVSADTAKIDLKRVSHHDFALAYCVAIWTSLFHTTTEHAVSRSKWILRST